MGYNIKFIKVTDKVLITDPQMKFVVSTMEGETLKETKLIVNPQALDETTKRSGLTFYKRDLDALIEVLIAAKTKLI